MYVFIDTNIYLNFYHYSIDDLEELKKLHVTITSGPINLLTTDQLLDEFARNREGKIADALKQFSEHKFPKKFPQLFKDFPEFESMKESIKNFDKSADMLLQKLQAGIHDKTLLADDEVQFLFDHSATIEVDGSILGAAKERKELRKPPGKPNSLGDAINWEALLAHVPEGEDLYFISGDVDYRSPLNPMKLAEYLREEWEQKKNSKIYYFDKLSDFFNLKYPTIKLASELEKAINVSNLISSSNFQTTHRSIMRLNVSDLTETESADLIHAFIQNDQIFWIAGDPDVQEFAHELFSKYGKMLDDDESARFTELYGKSQEAVQDPVDIADIPF